MTTTQQPARPMSATEIKLRAQHEAEATTLKWTLRNEEITRFTALLERQTAELAALRAAEKAGAPFETPAAKAKNRKAK